MLISIQHLSIIVLGIDHDLFTPIFAVSRVSGWIAHILEQYANNRLIRPRAEYTGPGMQKYVPIRKEDNYLLLIFKKCSKLVDDELKESF